MNKERLNELLKATSHAEHVLILTHNDPDPDAIGSAVALRHLLVTSHNARVEIAYRGIIGRAENKALVRYLNHTVVHAIDDVARNLEITFDEHQVIVMNRSNHRGHADLSRFF